jgi:acyl carrier protein
MSDVYQRFVKLLSGFGIQADEVQPDTTFNHLEFDSLALVEIAVASQGEFGVSVDNDDLTAGSTIAQAVEMIEAKLAGG